MSLKSQRWEGLQILMAIPTRELLADVNQNLQRQVWLSLGLIALMVPFGWLAGRRVGRSLSGLATQAQALARFDFRRPSQHHMSRVREVRALGQVMDRMSDTIQEFLHITHHISAESRLDLMLSSVLYELVRATSCTGGAVYLVEAQRAGLLRTARYCEDPEHQSLYPEHLPMVFFINPARQAIEKLAAESNSEPRAKQFPAHSMQVRELIDMVDYVGETSGLLFDPAPATYFLMDVMVSRTLPWVEAMGVLRGSGAGLLARGDASSVEIASALGVLRDLEVLTHGSEQRMASLQRQNEAPPAGGKKPKHR